MKFASVLSGATIALFLLAGNAPTSAAVPSPEARSFAALADPDSAPDTSFTDAGDEATGARPASKSIGQITFGLPIPPVPEPGTTALMLVGAAMISIALRRRRKHRA